MRNTEVKTAMAEAKLHQWEVARAINISEFTLCRWLREELDDEKRRRIMSAIDKLTRGGADHEG